MGRRFQTFSRIRFDIHELGESFGVLIFLGDVPEDPKKWQHTRTSIRITHTWESRLNTARRQTLCLKKSYPSAESTRPSRSDLVFLRIFVRTQLGYTLSGRQPLPRPDGTSILFVLSLQKLPPRWCSPLGSPGSALRILAEEKTKKRCQKGTIKT
jgi:hypothetical protein